MNYTKVAKVLANLKQLKAKGFYTEQGLCAACGIGYLGRETITPMFRTWDHYSGSIFYPVPYMLQTPHVGPKEAFLHTDGNMCNPKTEYGRLRIDLAEHCIKYLTELLENNDESGPYKASIAKPNTPAWKRICNRLRTMCHLRTI